MLVSHRKNFIFTRTVKTAGTTVEMYFEPWTMPAGEWEFSFFRPEYESETGIIGCRGPHQKGMTWQTHMSAVKIRNLLGTDTWNQYFKFCVIRNPFDRLVSGFHFWEKLHLEKSRTAKARALLTGNIIPSHLWQFLTGRSTIERFRNWLRKTHAKLFDDKNRYLIDDQVCVDYFIRFENLNGGIEEVCKQLEIPFQPEEVRRLNKGKTRRASVAEYYDSKSIEIVKRHYSFELDYFDYAPPANSH